MAPRTYDDDYLNEESVAASYDAAIAILRDHLREHKQTHPNTSFCDWIRCLHPENVRDGKLDHRFLIPENPWLKLFQEDETEYSTDSDDDDDDESYYHPVKPVPRQRRTIRRTLRQLWNKLVALFHRVIPGMKKRSLFNKKQKQPLLFKRMNGKLV